MIKNKSLFIAYCDSCGKKVGEGEREYEAMEDAITQGHFITTNTDPCSDYACNDCTCAALRMLIKSGVKLDPPEGLRWVITGDYMHCPNCKIEFDYYDDLEDAYNFCAGCGVKLDPPEEK